MSNFKNTAKGAYQHGDALKTAVLLLNLGTPKSPSTKDVRSFLKEFLSDKRVVEIPRAVWLPILYGIILPFRSPKSAKKYASIWQDGSPLMHHTIAQTKALQQRFSSENIEVVYAMRYGEHNIRNTLESLRQKNLYRLIVLPLYPQYSATTTGTSLDEIFKTLSTWRTQPSLVTINRYHDHNDYIQAMAKHIEAYWQTHGRPDFEAGDRLLFSFHGIPERCLTLGDFYHCECLKTGRLIAQALGLKAHENKEKQAYQVSFQSRLGKAKWLEPYTDHTIKKLAKTAKRLDVICPGFSVDCLETIEEIGDEGKEDFLSAGGKDYHYIPCLNDETHGIDMLEAIVRSYMPQAWLK